MEKYVGKGWCGKRKYEHASVGDTLLTISEDYN